MKCFWVIALLATATSVVHAEPVQPPPLRLQCYVYKQISSERYRFRVEFEAVPRVDFYLPLNIPEPAEVTYEFSGRGVVRIPLSAFHQPGQKRSRLVVQGDGFDALLLWERDSDRWIGWANGADFPQNRRALESDDPSMRFMILDCPLK
jgi:hypothetical protein